MGCTINFFFSIIYIKLYQSDAFERVLDRVECGSVILGQWLIESGAHLDVSISTVAIGTLIVVMTCGEY